MNPTLAELYQRHLQGHTLTADQITALFSHLAGASKEAARLMRSLDTVEMVEEAIRQGHPKHTEEGGAFYVVGQRLCRSPEAVKSTYRRHGVRHTGQKPRQLAPNGSRATPAC